MFSNLTSWLQSGQHSVANVTLSSTAQLNKAGANTTAIDVSKDICSVAFLVGEKDHVVGGGYGGKVGVWEARDGQEVGEAMNAGSTVLNIAVSGDGKWVVGGTGNGRVIVWDAERHEKVTELKAHGNWVRAVDVSPDMTRIASGSDDKTACVWSFRSGERLLGPLLHEHFLAAVKFSPNGDLLATATWWKESVRIYNGQDGTLLFDIPISVNSYENQSIAWLSNNTLLFALSIDGDIKCVDVSTGTVHSYWPSHIDRTNNLRCLIIPNNGKFIAASANSSVLFWDATTRKQIGGTVEHTDIIRSIAISPNCSLATGGGRTITIRSLDDILPSSYVDDTAPREQVIWHMKNMADHIGGSTNLPFDISYNEYLPNDLTNHVQRDGDDPVTSGGFGDIYRGMLQINWESIRVAIKAIRTYSAEDGSFFKKKKRLHREIKIWLSLKHVNVLPLLGTTTGFGRFPAMVCPWVDNGSLTTYLEDCYDKLLAVEILTLVNDVASGLQYLHSRSVVHGDLSGSNVLVCQNRRAYITDFGLSTLLTELSGYTSATSVHARGTLRWTAPELLDLQISEDEEEPLKIAPTKHTDVYSFGGVMLQTLAGKVPYHYYTREVQVVHAVSRGMTPKRPSSPLVTDHRWSFIQQCWSAGTLEASQSRPSSDDIAHFTSTELAGVMAS